MRNLYLHRQRVDTIISDDTHIESFVLTKEAPYLKVGQEVELIIELRSEDIVFSGIITNISNTAYHTNLH